MPEWLSSTPLEPAASTAIALAAKLCVALIFGVVIAGIHRFTRGRRGSIATLPATLVMLSVLIAVVTHVIGDHIARAFSLVGALSIVRFRTVVEDTFDIAFVIFAVVMGMAVGADQVTIAVIGTVFAGLASLIAPRLFEANGNGLAGHGFLLTIRTEFKNSPPNVTFGELWKDLFSTAILISGKTARSGSAMEYEYRVVTRGGNDPEQVLQRLRGVEGILSLEIKLH